MHDLSQPPANAADDLDLIIPGTASTVLVSPLTGYAADPANAAASPAPEDLDGWDVGQKVIASPDRAFLVGRYLHTGLPANSNGHIFRHDQIERRHLGVPHSPFDMLHDRRRVVGAYVATTIVDPTEDAKKLAADGLPVRDAAYTETPYVKSLAVVWSYLFPEDAKLIRDAYEAGLAFMSMSCLPDSVTCPTCEHNAAWAGYSSPTYCMHMQGRRPKWMENPLFLGGAAIVPPTRPGWSDALLTRYAAFMDAHPELTSDIFDKLHAHAPGATQRQLETVIAQLVGQAYDDEATDLDRRKMIAPLWEAMAARYPGVDFTPSIDVGIAADLEAARLTDDATVLARARALSDQSPVTAAGIERLVNELHPTASTDALVRDALGGATTYTWALDTYTAMLKADAKHQQADGSAMIALYPADPESVAVENGDLPSDLHITMAYLGKVAELTPEALERAKAALPTGQTAAGGPVEASVSGVGTLGTDGAVVLFLQAAELNAVHDALWDEIGAEGYAQQHPSFISHMTLGYAKDDDDLFGTLMAAGKPLVGKTITFDRIGIDIGTEGVTALPLRST